MNNRVTFVCQDCGYEETMYLFSWRPPGGLRCPKCYGMMREAGDERSNTEQSLKEAEESLRG